MATSKNTPKKSSAAKTPTSSKKQAAPRQSAKEKAAVEAATTEAEKLPQRDPEAGDEHDVPRPAAAQERLEELADGTEARTDGRPANKEETTAEGIIEAEAAILGTPDRDGPRVGAPVAPDLGHSLDEQIQRVTAPNGEVLEIDKVTTSKRDRIRQSEEFLAANA